MQKNVCERESTRQHQQCSAQLQLARATTPVRLGVFIPVQVAAGSGGEGGGGDGFGGGGDGGGASVVVHAGRSPANSHTNGLYTELSASSVVTVQKASFQTTVGVKLPSRVALPSANSWLVPVP